MSNDTNYRGRHERRQSESSLPAGYFDRRHNAERRLPEMAELKLSDMDHQRYFGTAVEPPEKSGQQKIQDSISESKKMS